MTRTQRQRPRIVVVHSSDELYGADRMLLHVVDAIVEGIDADVEVWLPDDVDHGPFPLCVELERRSIPWEHRSLPIMRRAYMSPLGLVRLGRVAWSHWRALRGDRPDMVYLASSACLVSAPLARLAGVRKRMLHLQEGWYGRTATVLRVLARSVTARITISQFVADTAGPLVRSTVVFNCVDDLGATHHRDAVSPEAPLRYLIASRWNRIKGHETMIAAWERAGCPGVLTVLGGPPPSGDVVDVNELVERMVTAPDSVRIVGEVGDIAPCLAEADVVVLPTDIPEGFGLVLIEAASMGLPSISSGAGGPLEVIEHGRSGWFFEPTDVDDLASVLISLDRNAVEDAGREARRNFESRFGSERYHEHVAQVISDELART